MQDETAKEAEPKTIYRFQIKGPSIVAAAFNRWLDEYENFPEKFEQQWATMRRHLKEKAEGVEPTYGEKCVGMLNSYIDELAAEEAGTNAAAVP